MMNENPNPGAQQPGSSPGPSYSSPGASSTEELAGEAKAQTQSIKDKVLTEVSERTRSVAVDQKNRAVKSLEGTARAFHQTSENLRGEDRELAAKYVDRLADQVDRFSGYLREKDPDDLIAEIEDSIRQRPGIALGTAAVLGFLAARFLKSSRSTTY